MSGRMSTKTGRAPRSTNALAVDTNVNDGHDDLVARAESSSSAAISRAWVHDVVSSTLGAPVIASSSVVAAGA